jgi:hypothetical protein
VLPTPVTRFATTAARPGTLSSPSMRNDATRVGAPSFTTKVTSTMPVPVARTTVSTVAPG